MFPPSKQEPPQGSPPQTYAQWSRCFDSLLQGIEDDATLEAMQLGVGNFDSGAVENVARRIIGVFDVRLQRCHGNFDRQSNGGPRVSQDATSVGRALLDFRRQLFFLYSVSQVRAFPESIQKHLCQMVDDAARNTQSSLEDSASKSRNNDLVRCVRQHSLLAFRQTYEAASPSSELQTYSKKPRDVVVHDEAHHHETTRGAITNVPTGTTTGEVSALNNTKPNFPARRKRDILLGPTLL